jgi:hypothetical protein
MTKMVFPKVYPVKKPRTLILQEVSRNFTKKDNKKPFPFGPLTPNPQIPYFIRDLAIF